MSRDLGILLRYYFFRIYNGCCSLATKRSITPPYATANKEGLSTMIYMLGLLTTQTPVYQYCISLFGFCFATLFPLPFCTREAQYLKGTRCIEHFYSLFVLLLPFPVLHCHKHILHLVLRLVYPCLSRVL